MMVDPIDSDADLRERLVYFVKQQGMAVGPETPEFERLMEAARAVYREYYPLPSPPPDMAVPAPVAQPRLFKPLTMDQLIRGWAKDTAPEEKTIYAWPKIMAKLTAHVGHDDITRITDTDVVSWKETLLASGLSRPR